MANSYLVLKKKFDDLKCNIESRISSIEYLISKTRNVVSDDVLIDMIIERLNEVSNVVKRED